MNDFLKKGAFEWNGKARLAFDKLKRALSTPRVLAFPDFEQTFEVETNASKARIGAVLMQKGHPIAFIRKSLEPKWQRLCVYEKELLAIVLPFQKWKRYLINNHFIIRTYKKSLTWLLQQKNIYSLSTLKTDGL